MTEEKNIDAGKKGNQPQDKLTDERLTDEQLDKVAGGGDTMRTREDWKKLLPFLTDDGGNTSVLTNGGKTSGK